MAALLETLNQDAGRLNLKFAKLERQYNFRQIAFFETKGLRVVRSHPCFVHLPEMAFFISLHAFSPYG